MNYHVQCVTANSITVFINSHLVNIMKIFYFTLSGQVGFSGSINLAKNTSCIWDF